MDGLPCRANNNLPATFPTLVDGSMNLDDQSEEFDICDRNAIDETSLIEVGANGFIGCVREETTMPHLLLNRHVVV